MTPQNRSSTSTDLGSMSFNLFERALTRSTTPHHLHHCRRGSVVKGSILQILSRREPRLTRCKAGKPLLKVARERNEVQLLTRKLLKGRRNLMRQRGHERHRGVDAVREAGPEQVDV